MFFQNLDPKYIRDVGDALVTSRPWKMAYLQV